MTIFEKFSNQSPMKYYDCGGKYESDKARQMIDNVGNGYIATLKSDGEWCRIIKGEDGRIIAQSRNISKVTGTYGDKTDLIPHIVAEFDNLPTGTVLLGELCFDNITTTAKDVGTILRCKAPKAIERQKNNKLYFKVFDCLAADESDISDKPFEYRFQVAKDLMLYLTENYATQYIKLCNYTESSFNDFLADILNRGGEGIVIHSRNYKYVPGGRPAWSTLKVKKTTGEIELPVMGLIAPNRLHEGTEPANYLNWLYWECWYTDNPQDRFLVEDPCADDYYNTTMTWEPVTKPYFKGWINGVIVEHNDNTVRVTSGLTDADREWLASYEGKLAVATGQCVAVISGMEITPDSIRHPRLIRLRTDL